MRGFFLFGVLGSILFAALGLCFVRCARACGSFAALSCLVIRCAQPCGTWHPCRFSIAIPWHYESLLKSAKVTKTLFS